MWLLPSAVSSVFAPESVCSTKDLASLFPDRVLWLTLSGKPTPRPLSWRGWKTKPWSLLLFGAGTLKTSTGSLGVEAWILSLPGSPALPSPTPADAKESKTSDGSSPTSAELFAKLAPDGCFLKMFSGYSQQMMDGSLEKFSGSWPRAGSMRSGSLYRRPPWVPPTIESESSSWPTPIAAPDAPNLNSNQRNGITSLGGGKQGLAHSRRKQRQLLERSEGRELEGSCGPLADAEYPERRPEEHGRGDPVQRIDGGGKRQVSLEAVSEYAMKKTIGGGQWPTPTRKDSEAAGAFKKRDTLNSMATKKWLSPKQPSGGGQAERTTPGGGLRKLEDQVVTWATPNAHDGRRPGNDVHSTQGGNLNREAATWPTPNARDAKGEDLKSRRGGGKPEPLCGERRAVTSFPPGYDSDEWGEVIEEVPQLAPAVEPGFCVLVDGVAVVVDQGRTDQLRCSGNGVVALQAAVAATILDRRAGAGLIEKSEQSS